MVLSVCNGCTKCGLRCASDIPATKYEWEQIQEFIENASEVKKEFIQDVQNQDKTVDLGDEVSVQMCRFWDMNSQKCVVYSVRPLVCRLLGHVEWMPCPIEKVPKILPTEKALNLMESYAHFERKTFAEWEKERL